MSTYGILGGVGVIIFLLTIGYFFLMFFYPEWVGMSGEDTRKTLETHRDEKSDDDTSSD